MILQARLGGVKGRNHSFSRRLLAHRHRVEGVGPHWADEKLALHKLGVHPDSVARFSPLANSPPLSEGRKGGVVLLGSGGVVPAEPGPGTRFRGD